MCILFVTQTGMPGLIVSVKDRIGLVLFDPLPHIDLSTEILVKKYDLAL